MMRKVYIIRHAESAANAGLVTSVPADIPLSNLGKEQAEHLASVFVQAPSLVVTSPYLRTKLTAQPLISRFPQTHQEEWQVQEFTYLDLNKYKNTTEQDRRPFVNAFWQRSDPFYSGGFGTESFAAFIQRVDTLMERLSTNPSDSIAVFTHGYVTRSILWKLKENILEITSETMRSFHEFCKVTTFPNTAVLELRFDEKNGGMISHQVFNPPFEGIKFQDTENVI